MGEGERIGGGQAGNSGDEDRAMAPSKECAKAVSKEGQEAAEEDEIEGLLEGLASSRLFTLGVLLHISCANVSTSEYGKLPGDF